MRSLPAFGLQRMATGASLGPSEFGGCLHLGFRIGRMDKRHDDDTYDAECDPAMIDMRVAKFNLRLRAIGGFSMAPGISKAIADIRPFTRSRVGGECFS